MTTHDAANLFFHRPWGDTKWMFYTGYHQEYANIRLRADLSWDEMGPIIFNVQLSKAELAVFTAETLVPHIEQLVVASFIANGTDAIPEYPI